MENIAKECQRIEEDALYSSKGHFNAADRWGEIHFLINIPLVILAAWAGLDIFKNDAQLAGYIAMATVLLAAFNTVQNPDQKSAQHGASARNYNALKNDARIFRLVELTTFDEDDAKGKLLELNKRRTDLNSNSLGIPNWAFKKARQGIEEGEAKYQADGDNV